MRACVRAHVCIFMKLPYFCGCDFIDSCLVTSFGQFVASAFDTTGMFIVEDADNLCCEIKR